jgi:hypothetical protein
MVSKRFQQFQRCKSTCAQSFLISPVNFLSIQLSITGPCQSPEDRILTPSAAIADAQGPEPLGQEWLSGEGAAVQVPIVGDGT